VYVDDLVAIFTCNGSPEGVIFANTGSIALSDNTGVYKKTTDLSNTGWVELTGGNITGNLTVGGDLDVNGGDVTITGTSPTLSFVDTSAGDSDGIIRMDLDFLDIVIDGGTPIRFKSNGYIVGYQRSVIDDSTFAGTGANTTLTTLATLVLPANSLAANGDRFFIDVFGGFGVNANDKRVTLAFGGNVVWDPFGAAHAIDGGGWWLRLGIRRLSATTVKYSIAGIEGQSNIPAFYAAFPATGGTPANTGIITVADLAVNATNIVIQGQNGTANANDVIYLQASGFVVQNV
jgi:hypothetical protein